MRKFFYIIKPLIPRSLQIFLRRILIRIKKKKYENVWPIFPGSEVQPKAWKGWRDGKRFAFILTHDVEKKTGYDRVTQLMKIEKELGFVSSFNFVPERDYKVSQELLNTLQQNGFEFGVHGLNHDGKLFSSEQVFSERSKKINHYINKWGAVGFRAPAMHHNLKWIGKLNLQYDLSTFDTDPFEPQADGTNTIFPFWVKSENREHGFVELPYTLVQDFTIFILLKEKSPDIWVKKLDWIAEKGGMALLNVHPDYINFDDRNKLEEFPISYYKEFLIYVKNKYSGQYWNALPRDIANYSKQFLQ